MPEMGQGSGRIGSHHYLARYGYDYNSTGFFSVAPNAGKPTLRDDWPVRDWVGDYLDEARSIDTQLLSVTRAELSGLHLIPRTEDESTGAMLFDETDGGFEPATGGSKTGADLPDWMMVDEIPGGDGASMIRWD